LLSRAIIRLEIRGRSIQKANMGTRGRQFIERLAAEPPLRILARGLVGKIKCLSSTRALWDLSARPPYLLGIVAAAAQAKRQLINKISVIEFGVAGGAGLIAMQEEAAVVERETGVLIKVYGFDMGPTGLPSFIGDHRDHPEEWKPGDFPMDVAALRARLDDRTKLVLGNIGDTVPTFFENFSPAPIGFVSIDLDLYSSTRDALRVFLGPGERMLWHTPMYFDDIDSMFNHRFAGERLAIDDFNASSAHVKIDKWHGVQRGRPFPERPYLQQMYVAHDLRATAAVRLERAPGILTL
jgi:hypothetical protein